MTWRPDTPASKLCPSKLCPMCKIGRRFIQGGRTPGKGWWFEYCSKRCARVVVSVAFLDHSLSPHLQGPLDRLEESELPE